MVKIPIQRVSQATVLLGRCDARVPELRSRKRVIIEQKKLSQDKLTMLEDDSAGARAPVIGRFSAEGVDEALGIATLSEILDNAVAIKRIEAKV